jgi:hypothetical protein
MVRRHDFRKNYPQNLSAFCRKPDFTQKSPVTDPGFPPYGIMTEKKVGPQQLEKNPYLRAH